MEFNCPHCKSAGCATRVQGPDDLQYQVGIDTIRELWQCERCDEYFTVEYKLSKITALVEKE